jgi:hypothetical protein
MKKATAALTLILSGCGTVQWVRAPEVSEADCTAVCDAHYGQCPQVFAGFPERGAVECPAEHNNCLRACASGHASAAAVPAPSAASSLHAVPSKEARLRELKHFYEEGLVSEDVYRERQKAILAEP